MTSSDGEQDSAAAHSTGVQKETLCLGVCSRKTGTILFTCLLQSWLWWLIHVSSSAGDSWMNDAI